MLVRILEMRESNIELIRISVCVYLAIISIF